MAAIIRTETRYVSGALASEQWKQLEIMHRPHDLPGSIGYCDNGSLCWQAWYQHGLLHRSHSEQLQSGQSQSGQSQSVCDQQDQRKQALPALIYYRADGTIRSQSWYQNDLLHRDLNDGPAIIMYHDNGRVTSRWYLEGEFRSELIVYPEPAFVDLVKGAASDQVGLQYDEE